MKIQLISLGLVFSGLVFIACGQESGSAVKAKEKNKSLTLEDFEKDSDSDVNYKEESHKGQFQKRDSNWRWQDKGVQKSKSGKWDFNVCKGSKVTATDSEGRPWGYENGKSCKIVE